MRDENLIYVLFIICAWKCALIVRFMQARESKFKPCLHRRNTAYISWRYVMIYPCIPLSWVPVLQGKWQ